MTNPECVGTPRRTEAAIAGRRKHAARRRDTAAAAQLLLAGWELTPPKDWEGPWPLTERELSGAVR